MVILRISALRNISVLSEEKKLGELIKTSSNRDYKYETNWYWLVEKVDFPELFKYFHCEIRFKFIFFFFYRFKRLCCKQLQYSINNQRIIISSITQSDSFENLRFQGRLFFFSFQEKTCSPQTHYSISKKTYLYVVIYEYLRVFISRFLHNILSS